LQSGARVDVAFTLEDDSYAAARGLPPWGAVLRDVRPTGGANVAAVAPLELKEWNQHKHVGLSGPTFPDLPKKNLPEPLRIAQLCRECNCEFVAGPDHIGYINVCPECRIAMLLRPPE
jgi:hypothetical protein